MEQIRRALRISFVLSLVFISSAQAQLSWDVTASDLGGYDLRWMGCSGNTCTACTQLYSYDSSAFQTVFWRSDDAGRTWATNGNKLFLQYPAPRSSDERGTVHKLWQTDSLHAIAVGDRGLIVESTNAGKTWRQVYCPVSSDLVDVHCSSPTQGIIVGYNPPVVLILGEAGWVCAPFQLSHNYYQEGGRYKYWQSIFCRSYSHGKYRIVGPSYWVDSTRQTELPMYTTRTGWETTDSILIPLKHPHERPFWVDLSCSFGYDDTLLVARTTYDSLTFQFWKGIVSRTLDGGKTWQSFTDTRKGFSGFGYLSPIMHDTLLSLVCWTDSSGYYSPYHLMSSIDLGANWRLDTLLLNVEEPYQVPLSFLSSAQMVDGSIVTAFGAGMGVSYGQHGHIARLQTSLDRATVSSRPSPYAAFRIYPNPATDIVRVEDLLGPVVVFDPLGRSYALPHQENAFTVSRLPSGIYFISDGHSRASFVKE